MLRAPRSLTSVLAVAGLVLALAACGSDDESTSTTSGTAAASGSATTTAGTTNAGSTSVAGSAPAGAGGTIKIGVANNEGTLLSIPDYRYGAEAAVKYINEQLGGVNGAQLEIESCIDDATPEGSVNCANKFVDADVVAYFAAIDVGADAALPILAEAKIPYVSTEPWGAQQKVDPNSWVFGPAQGTYAVGPLKALKDKGATKVAAFFLDQPTAHDLITNVAEPVATQLGLELVPVFVDTTNPNWDTAVATAVSQGVDAMWGILPEPSCTSAVTAARNGGFDGPFAVGSCSQYILDAPAAALNTLTVSSTWYPAQGDSAPAEIKAQLDTYSAAMEAAGHEDSINTFAVGSFATMMELAQVLETVDGPVTAVSLAAALNEATDMPGFMREGLHCRTNLWPSEPSTCRASLLSLTVEPGPDGKPVKVPDSPNMIDLSSFAI